MPYLPCSSSSMYSRGNMLSHASKHSFMALMIILAFYPQLNTPILPVLHTCGVLTDSHRCNSTPPNQQTTEAGAATVKRSQLAAETPLRLESLPFPCLDSSHPPYSGADPDFVGLKLR